MRIDFIIISLFEWFSALSNMADTAIVNVDQGALRGYKVTSKAGCTYYSFKGIPYAKPPIGPLRFKAPQSPESWTGIRDAQEEGNVCPQINTKTKQFVGDEDCLFLNVYSTQLPDGTPTRLELKKAVMVYIHGGAFTSGSGNAELYGPDYLVAEDVVLVTLNYRLGALGFLTTGDGEAPGNAGLKDQVAALRWVQLNIARFGGDSNNVTIFGNSAGGISVHYLMLSPSAKGLFHRAISQSGTALIPTVFSKQGRTRTIRLAKALGCTSENSKDVLAFLRDIPSQKLVESIQLSLAVEELQRGLFPFVPTSEAGIISSEEVFLPRDPIDIIKSGNFNRVPYITGFNTNEGHLVLLGIVGKPDLLKLLDTDFQVFLPLDLFPDLNTEKSREAALEMKSFYFGDTPLSEDTLHLLSEMHTGVIMRYCLNTVREHLLFASADLPLYHYEFAFDGKRALFRKHTGLETMPGVAHADELGYLFTMASLNEDLSPDSPEMKVVSTIVKMWANFAKQGTPAILGVSWDPVTHSNTNYMRIDVESAMLKDPANRSLQFWDELYRKFTVDDDGQPTTK